ncbi:hypothetical protein B0H34DRAFT_125286 [Crassisporium funariophilum]|nr:hypothetical protein B0H34DRAFT_125286 [Crassisporium funariophilum]
MPLDQVLPIKTLMSQGNIAHHKMNDSNTIPLELFGKIIQELSDVPTLRALLLTCKSLRTESERLLYRSFTLSSYPHHRQGLLFLMTISRNPQLASYVREYHFDVRASLLPRWESDGSAAPDWAPIIRCAFRNLGNMKAFSYTASDWADEVLLVDCKFRLVKLVWISPNFGLTQVDAFLPQFLQSQEQLRELDVLIRPVSCASVLPGICPNLWSFAGSLDTITLFLPGRNIKRLTWTQCGENEDRLRESMSRLSRAFNNLRTLTIWVVRKEPRGSGWGALALSADHLGSLEVLRLNSAYQQDIEQASTVP